MDALLAALANGLITLAVFAGLGTVALGAVALFCTVFNAVIIAPIKKAVTGKDDYVPEPIPCKRTGGVS